MIKPFLTVSKHFVMCIFWMFVITPFVNAQDLNAIPDIEKIYLHTDRSSYFMGEDLWYKAYDVFAYNNLLFDKSNVLYVELISSDSKIIAQNKTNLEMGLGHGDFKLTDSLGIKPGIYQLRAYTNWDRNFGSDFVFKKNIEIIDVFDAQSKNLKALQEGSVNNITENKPQENVKIDFFPEGGSLLENVPSIVGFKAVDSYGNPITVEGKVFDSDDELVTMFLSTHDGMGKFQFIPIKGKTYYTIIKKINGAEIKQELPKANQFGYVLSYKTFKEKSIVSIKTNEQTLLKNPNALITIIGKSRGISYLEGTQTLTGTNLSFELPVARFPAGIAQLTLYDSNYKPQSERLVYIEKEQDLEFSMSTNKQIYKPKEKVTVHVSSKSKAGDPRPASFSLSSTDMNGFTEEKDLGSNICSYFLMESDIRGKINNPGYYFDASNPKRLNDLDLLLLTQGWRDFLWKQMPKVTDTLAFNTEKGLSISGRVKQLLGEKPKANQNMTLALMNKNGMNIFNAVTDSLGAFKFENLMFSGKTNMFLNSRNDKGKFRGEIVLNPIEHKPMPVDFKKQTTKLPQINSTGAKTIVENVYKKYVAYGIAPDNILAEVEIIGKKKTNRTSLYGMPDFSYVPDENTPVFNDILQFIQATIPGTVLEQGGGPSGDYIRFMRYDKDQAALILINDFPIYDISELDFYQPDDVEKIDAIRGGGSAAIFGSDGAYGVISIYIKEGVSNSSEKPVFHSIKEEIEGFYEARVFYSPDPEKPDPDLHNKSAVRNTLYWNPYVHPDETGNAQVSYYNSNAETKVKVSLEGITATGIPIVKKVFYNIEK